MSDSLSSSTGADDRRWLYFFIILAVVARLVFWWTTDRVWEDAYITLRHAENAARGLGLTHHPAQGLVHGFTSAISVLIPLVGELLWRGSGLLVLKLSSLVASVLTISTGYRIARHSSISLSLPVMGFFLGLLAFEYHQILFGMAGMETQWVVLITLWTVLQYLEGDAYRLGLACGLCLWARPDGVIMILAVLCGLVWQRRFNALPKVIGVALLTIAPWILFTQWYYGSWVPHTVVAKKVAFVNSRASLPDWSRWFDSWRTELWRRTMVMRVWLSPTYAGSGSSAVNFIRGARLWQALYGCVALLGVIVGLRRGITSVVSFYAVGFAAYVILVLPFPYFWYLMPWTAVLALVFCLGADSLRLKYPSRRVSMLVGAMAIGFLGLYAFACARAIPAERYQQQGIETGCRMQVGKWLEQHVAPGHWIGCECLGYLGSFSNRPILDYPGLSSPRSVAALRKLPEGERSLVALIAMEKPEWIVLRPEELALFQAYDRTAADRYVEAQRFHADREAIERISEWLWFDGFVLTIDEAFIVLRRDDVQPQP